MQIQISWLLQKPTDLDLHCLQRQGISGFSRTRVKSIFLAHIFQKSVKIFFQHWSYNSNFGALVSDSDIEPLAQTNVLKRRKEKRTKEYQNIKLPLVVNSSGKKHKIRSVIQALHNFKECLLKVNKQLYFQY